MTPSEITIYSSTGHRVSRADLELADASDPLTLAGVHRRHIDDAVACYATIRSGPMLRALYLAAPWVPRVALHLQRTQSRSGQWLTSSLQVGPPGLGKAWIGPRLFLRQLDIGEVDAWLAPVLLGLPARVEPQRLDLADQPVYAWQLGGSRFYYTAQGPSFHLHGGGNTPSDRLSRLLEEEAPASASEFLWTVGAVKLA